MFVCSACGQSFPDPGFCTQDGAALADVSSDPLLGQTIGSYRLARVLGRGGMGVVYLGVHPRIGSRVAVKVLSAAASGDPTTVERFFAEARAVNVIRHEGIVNVLDLSTLPDGRPYITMEYLEGASLSQRFSESRPFPLDVLARISLEVLGALAAAHALGITHRDLKPDNIFITSLGRVKVLDFGIAKLRPEQGALHDGTQTGALLGTPQYMSPEQALGKYVDPRSDLYSLGLILFEGATGERPFRAESLFELLRQHIEQQPPSPRSLRSDLPAALEAVIARMLEKDRGRRFQTAEECAVALEVAARGLPPSHHGTAPGIGSWSAGARPSVPGMVDPTVSATTFAATSAPKRGPALGIWLGVSAVGAALALLALGGLALVFSPSFVGRGAARTQSPPADSPGTATSVAPPGTVSGSASGRRVDLMASLTKAIAAAKREFADAGLVSLSVSGIERDGSVDVSKPTHAVSFVFRSPSATGDLCLVSVSTSNWGTFASKLKDQSHDCKQPILEAPRCQAKDVLGEVPATKAIHSLVLQNSTGVWQWVVMTDGGASLQIRPDNC